MLQQLHFQNLALRRSFVDMMVSAIKPQDVERFAAQQIAFRVSGGKFRRLCE